MSFYNTRNRIFANAFMKEIKVGYQGVLPSRTLSKVEVVEYAKKYDPLPFHIDEAFAKKSIFKGLAASGSQAFRTIYAESWVPKFGNSIIAGLSVNHWNFLKPIYAESPIYTKYEVLKILNTGRPNERIITRKFSFFNSLNELVQSLEIKILHHKDLILKS